LTGVARDATAAAEVETALWYPRSTGWSTDELSEYRKTISSTFPEPGSDYTGPRYTGPSSVTPAFIDELISMQKDGKLLPKKDAYLLVLDVIDVLRGEQTIAKVSLPVGTKITVVGDLHGQYWDFANILNLVGKPSPEAPFLFNGDFVDRGSWSIEVIMVIFAFKLKDPGFVHLNRGNHEMLETNILYGFCGECGCKYDFGLFDLFSEAFRNLPLGHLIDDKVLVVHAGLPGPDPRIWMPGQTHDPTDSIPMTPLPTIEEINSVDRYSEITPEAYRESLGPTTDDKEVNDLRRIIDMLWSDPRGGNGYGPSYRKAKGVYMFGPDVTKAFIEQNKLQCIIRSHEVKAAGYRWDHPELVSVFSAPNYLDTGNNMGAVLHLTKSAPEARIDIEAVCFDAVPHPDLPPMHWQDFIMTNHSHLTKTMKKVKQSVGDEFGDSDFGGYLNIEEWEPDEAEHFQDAFMVDQYGRSSEDIKK